MIFDFLMLGGLLTMVKTCIQLQSVFKQMVQSENICFNYEICSNSMCIWYHIKAE